MSDVITHLESPIDVMILMHKAFNRCSERTEEIAAKFGDGQDISELKKSFEFWTTQLLYHADAEDEYMTGPITDSQPARDNETEHAELKDQGAKIVAFLNEGEEAGLDQGLQAALLALDEEQHHELVERIDEIKGLLRDTLGPEKVRARTARHLYKLIMKLRILEFDHFENEEAFVLPLVKDHFDEAGELEICRQLLFDQSADNPRWIIDWVSSELDPDEQTMLAELESQLQVSA